MAQTKAQLEVAKTREVLAKQADELEMCMYRMVISDERYPIFLTKIGNLIEEMREVANG